MSTKRFKLEVEDFLTKEECEKHILVAEEHGFDEATIQTRGEGQVMDKSIRDNDRFVLDLPELASELFDRMKHHVPELILGKEGHNWKPIGNSKIFPNLGAIIKLYQSEVH